MDQKIVGRYVLHLWLNQELKRVPWCGKVVRKLAGNKMEICKHFLKICKQMFDKMSSVSSKNVKTNLLRHVACLNTFSSHCLHYMLLETSLRFLKILQKDCQWLFVNISFADSLRFVFKNQKQNVYKPLAKFSLRYLFIDCLRFASFS